MRLCLNDSNLGGPYRNLTATQLHVHRDIGYRVVGIGCDYNATDDDIARVRDLFGESGLAFGPMGLGVSTISTNPTRQREMKQQIASALGVAGRLGVPSLRYSVGSMHPTDIWRHHPDNHTQQAMDLLVESVRDLIPIAEDNGCMLCPETNAWTIVNSIERMKEYVDRLESPYAKIIFDPVNHMNPQRVFDSGRWMKCAIAYLGDRIGVLHVKDVMVMENYMIHIEETHMGEGLLDHAAIIEASAQLEPWKTFSLEHFRPNDQVSIEELWRRAYVRIMSAADRIGHRFTDPQLTRPRWEQMQNRL